MSSSEESDDEEARRISEAVSCNESRADSFASKNENKTSAESHIESQYQQAGASSRQQEHLKSVANALAKRASGKFKPYHEAFNDSGVPIKSNRPQSNDAGDDDVNNRLQLKTTPEFRAFVAKHLEKHLDKELESCLASSVWSPLTQDGRNKKCEIKHRLAGIRLLSNSKSLLADEANPGNANKSGQSQAKNSSSTGKGSPRVKKPRLSTSSESSEDERIQACIFTVDDIEEENKTLASLARKDNPDSLVEPQNTSSVTPCGEKDGVEDLNDKSLKKVKKKKKKKKKKSEIKEMHVS